MLYLQKYLTNFQKLFCLKDEGRVSCGWKFEVHRYFSFAIATLQLFQYPENVKISIFPITLSQQKCYIFKSDLIQYSNTFFWLKDEERGYSGWKFKMHRHFSFAIATLQLFQYPEKCKTFNFSHYTVPGEMPYLQKYLTNFQKHFFGSKMMNVAILVENLRCTDILVSQ